MSGQGNRSGAAPRLSIIVPALNEATDLPRLAAQLEQWQTAAETILVDGGSTDDTLALASKCFDQVLSSAPGRARQQNAGAALARGDYLLFLHCDTQLHITPDALIAVLEERPRWGFFDVRLSGRDWRFRVIERCMIWRSRISRVATGDQCLLVERALFESLGGFGDMPLMEDVELSKRLRRAARPRVLQPAVTTSSRRWERRGVMRTVLLMWELRLRYWWGADTETLAVRYRGG